MPTHRQRSLNCKRIEMMIERRQEMQGNGIAGTYGTAQDKT
jgi:hypothetical protein